MAASNAVTLPVEYLPEHEMEHAKSRLKERSGKWLALGEVEDPGEPPHTEGESPQHGELAKGRRRVECWVFGPEDWNFLFPKNPSQYGGIACLLLPRR